MEHNATASGAALDSEELLHLALKAGQANDSERAVGFLQRILETEPDNAMALYLLGAHHASMRLYEQAKAEMARAIELEPKLPPTARFQLGLLYLTSGEVSPAMVTWGPLDELGEDHPLYLFKRGLTHLVRTGFALCIEDLERGIAANEAHAAINKDMRLFVSRARDALAARDEAALAAHSTSNETPAPAARLSAYEKPSDEGSA